MAPRSPLLLAATATAAALLSLTAYVACKYYCNKRRQTGRHLLYVCVTCSVANRPGAPLPGVEGKPKSGEALHQVILNAFLEREAEWIHLPNEAGVCYALRSNPAQIVEIREQKCFGACSRACSVVLTAPHKFGYHVAELEACPEDASDVLDLVATWVAAPDACCLKKGERPGKTATNCISRQPPSLPAVNGGGCCGGGCFAK